MNDNILKDLNKNMTTVFKALAVAGSLLLNISFFLLDKGAYNAYISGYIIYCIVFFISAFLIFMNYSSISNVNFSIILVVLPSFLFIALLGYYISLLFKYKDNIKLGHISKSFIGFNNTLMILFFVITAIYYKYFTNNIENNSPQLPKLSNSVLYLLFVLCFINLTILNIILKYYTTDG